MPFFILWTTEWSPTQFFIPCYLYNYVVFLIFSILECDVQINTKTSSIFTSIYRSCTKCYWLDTFSKVLVEQGQLQVFAPQSYYFLFLLNAFLICVLIVEPNKNKGQLQVFASQVYLYFPFLLNVFLICIPIVEANQNKSHLNLLPLSFLVYILDRW